MNISTTTCVFNGAPAGVPRVMKELNMKQNGYNCIDIIGLRDSRGDCALHWAVRNGNKKALVDSVERYSMDIDCQNYEGETALSIAILQKWGMAVSYLVEKGANLNIPNIRGEMPLHLAVAIKDIDIVRLLVKEGAWLDSGDELGDTPLHYAVREELPEVVEFLLGHGADSEHENEDQETPQDLAKIVASETIQNYFQIYNDSNIDDAMAIDGDAVGAIGMSSEMKLNFSVDKISSRFERMAIDDSESDGVTLGSSLGQSGSVPTLASYSKSTVLFSHFSGTPNEKGYPHTAHYTISHKGRKIDVN